MQRKNNILKSSRKGMAMIMAIAVIVIVATILALALALTIQTSKRTTDVYLYEQSVLLSKSATEYALLNISQNPPCTFLDQNFMQDSIYNIDISIKYIYDSNAPCTANANPGVLYTTVTTPEQNGSVLMDVTVSSIAGSEPIRYFRRTIQKL
jgi:type II secretory pathway pseudopilin PulG